LIACYLNLIAVTLSYGCPFNRDEENEDMMQQMIYENARGPEPDGEDDDFSSQFLNDSGEGLESEERRDDEVPLTNSGEVYI